MTFDYPGYQIKFIQKDVCKDTSKHLFTLIYKFYSPVTRYHYIIQVAEHSGDVFAVKFYCKKDRRSDHKFSKITNKGDLGNILNSCLSVIPDILYRNPKASFAFAGASSVDLRSRKREKNTTTQRYRIYKYIVSILIGQDTLAHFQYDRLSSYLLINRKVGDGTAKEISIKKMFSETYLNLEDIQN